MYEDWDHSYIPRDVSKGSVIQENPARECSQSGILLDNPPDVCTTFIWVNRAEICDVRKSKDTIWDLS